MWVWRGGSNNSVIKTGERRIENQFQGAVQKTVVKFFKIFFSLLYPAAVQTWIFSQPHINHSCEQNLFPGKLHKLHLLYPQFQRNITGRLPAYF